MIRNFKLYFLLALVIAMAVQVAPAQTPATCTTLAAAMTDSQNTIKFTSATNVNAQTGTGPITGWYTDEEFGYIGDLVTGTTDTFRVIRGRAGRQTAHASGATICVGPLAKGPFFLASHGATIKGSCSRTAELYLPRYYVATGEVAECKSGQWIVTQRGTMASTGTRIGASCTGTVGSAETEYLNSAACSGATTSTTRHVVTGPGVLANLRVYSSAAVVGGTSKDVLTVYKNGSATALTCTISASGTTCSDTSHSVNVVAGDVITFQFVTATSDTAANVSAGVGVY